MPDFVNELVQLLCGLDAEPWSLRPTDDDTAKLLVGANPGRVRGRLDGAGYAVRDLGLPVEQDGWMGAWEVSAQ